MPVTPSKHKSNTLVLALPFIVIAIGIWIRIGAYVSNRTLILDEANVALNLHQRNYAELLKPLDYNQYAPPGFLWILKLSVQLLGYSEYAFRLFPLLCGVISIYLFYQLLLKFCSRAASIYPLWLMATGYIYLYYSSCIKQYSSDVLIVLVLLWLVLKTDLHTKKPLAFIAIWALAGGLLWFSMPVVFILCGASFYYLYQVWKSKAWTKLPQLIIVFSIWVLQFAPYYYYLLRGQVSSNYLQSFHQIYFSILFPTSILEWQTNIDVYLRITAAMAGETTLAQAVNILCIILGFIHLYRNSVEKFLLFFIPSVLLYIAAGLHVYTLLPRVVLFIMPMWLLLAGIGIDSILNHPIRKLSYFVAIPLVICAYNFAQLKYLATPLKDEEFKQSMDYAIQHNIVGKHFHVSELIKNLHKYYVYVHPQNRQWLLLKDADILPMDANDKVTERAERVSRDMVVYCWLPEEILMRDSVIFSKHTVVTPLNIEGTHSYLCTKR